MRKERKTDLVKCEANLKHSLHRGKGMENKFHGCLRHKMQDIGLGASKFFNKIKWQHEAYKISRCSWFKKKIDLVIYVAYWANFSEESEHTNQLFRALTKIFSSRSFPHLSLFQPLEFVAWRTVTSQRTLYKWSVACCSKVAAAKPSHLNLMIWAEACFLKGIPQDFALCIERKDHGVDT